jgi:hypothetical protein
LKVPIHPLHPHLTLLDMPCLLTAKNAPLWDGNAPDGRRQENRPIPAAFLYYNPFRNLRARTVDLMLTSGTFWYAAGMKIGDARAPLLIVGVGMRLPGTRGGCALR